MDAITDVLRNIYHNVSPTRGRMRPSNRVLIRRYASSNGVKKLHLGCGSHILPGWLNTDWTSSSAVAYLDFTKRFPFGNDTFDYAFTEHGIEHIPYAQGSGMLQEAFRVLKPGGKIRVVTPDFEFLKALHQTDKSETQKAYITWASEQWLGGRTPPAAEMHVINNFFRNWGHLFIYDQQSLSTVLQTAGFSGIKRCEVNESDDPALRCLENENRMPPGFLRLESMVFEAVKPGNRQGRGDQDSSSVPCCEREPGLP